MRIDLGVKGGVLLLFPHGTFTRRHDSNSDKATGGGSCTRQRAGGADRDAVEIIDVPIRIEEHRGLAYWCPSCQKFHYAPLPPEVERGRLFGPRLTTLVAYMKGVCHASFSTIRKFIRDVVGIKVSRGYLRKLIAKMSDALKPCYDELLAALPNANTLNIDETGHKENGDRFWTWCFRAEIGANEFGQPSPPARNAAWTYSSSFANHYCPIGRAHLGPACFSTPDSRAARPGLFSSRARLRLKAPATAGIRRFTERAVNRHPVFKQRRLRGVSDCIPGQEPLICADERQ